MPVATDDSSCVYVPQFWGMPADQLAATAANICIAVIGLLSLVYYGAHAYLSTCGWEEVYVCIVELIKVFAEVFLEYCVPVTFNEINGNHIVWIRYAEWLLTCPVILIHLSNLTGLADDYSHRTMALLVTDIGTIVMGVTAAIASGYVKVAFFLLGLCYGCMTFKIAAQIHLEAYYAMPKGHCKQLVMWMALVFLSSWMGYPILFMLGPEGFYKKLTPWNSVLGHCIVDVLSKNVWGFLGHHLRIKVQEHIVIYGIVRVRQTHKFLGLFELEVETFVKGDAFAGAVRTSVAGMGHRRSLEKVRSNLIAKGHACPELDPPPPSHGVSMAGHVMGSATGGCEFIMPSQFLLGNPRWQSSLSGQRVHPSAGEAGADDGSQGKPLSRGISLDWPGRVPGAWPKAPAKYLGRSEEAVPAAAPSAEGQGQADGVAAVAVRSKADVGADATKKE